MPEVSCELGTGSLGVWGPGFLSLGVWGPLTPGLREKDTGGQQSRVLGKEGAEAWTPLSE